MGERLGISPTCARWRFHDGLHMSDSITNDTDDVLDEEVLPIPGVGRAVELTVQAKTAGQRLDQYLAAQFPDFSRSLIQKAIEAKSVTVGGAPSKASFKVRVAAVIRI